MHFKYFSFLLFFSFFHLTFAQGGASSCAELEANFQLYQSCATNIPFQNSTNGNSESFSTTCIGGAFQGPTWFYMRVQQDGDIRLEISQISDSGNGTDVDFVIWGPFTNLNNICSQLNPSKEVDCSYLPDAVETVRIPVSNSGDLYVLLVDNYSNVPGQITIRQTGGSGSSDCSFLSSVDILDDTGAEITQLNYCQPQTKNLVATVDTDDFPGNIADLRFNYKWFFNDSLVSDVVNSTFNTNTFVADETGNYRVEITAYDVTDPDVVVADLQVSTDEIDLIFYGTPTLFSGLQLEKCDSTAPYDRLQNVNLAEIQSVITPGGDFPVLFKYYLDAARTQEIIDVVGFVNSTPTQTIYVDAAYDFSCASNIASTSFDVVVTTLDASTNNSAPIIKCDSSGFSTFDLRIREAVMAQPSATSDINFKYYILRSDAVANAANFITDPSNFTNTFATSQIIYVRLSEASDPDNSCFRILELQLLVNPIPPNNIQSNPYTVCLVQGSVNDPAEISTGLPASNYSFTWYRNSGALPGNEISGETNPDFSTVDGGSYSVKIINTLNAGACERIVDFTVVEANIPSGTTNPQPIYLCDDSGFAEFDLRIREAEMAETLNASDLVFRYYTNRNDALTNASNFIADPENHTNLIVNEETIYVRISNTNSPDSDCAVVVELDLFVKPLPANNLRTYPYRICMNVFGQPVEPAIVDTRLNNLEYSFSWHRGFNGVASNAIIGETDPIFETTVGGDYSVVITNITNPAMCQTVVNFTVLTADVPFNIDATPIEQVSFDGNATVTVSLQHMSPDFQFMIDNNGWQDSPTFTNILPGFHTVSVRNKFGCETTSTRIVVVDYMKVFTPNGDGYNDFWTVGGRAIFDTHKLYIFDRYGKLIVDISGNLRGWDGTFNGKPLPADDYWFKIVYEKNGVPGEYRNHFSLKR